LYQIVYHYQAFGLLFLPAIAFIVKRKNFFQHIILFGLGLFLSFIPLIIFNINHQWHTIAGFIQYVEQGRSAVPDRWIYYVRDFWPHFVAYVLGVPTIFGYIIFGYIGLVFIYLAYLRKINAIYYWLFVVFLLNFIFLRYGTSIRENYYFIYMHGFIFIFVSYALWQTFKNRYTTICSLLLISGILFFILKEDIRRLKSEEFVVDVAGDAGVFQTDKCVNDRIAERKDVVFHCEIIPHANPLKTQTPERSVPAFLVIAVVVHSCADRGKNV
jgi:hypothetical protein